MGTANFRPSPESTDDAKQQEMIDDSALAAAGSRFDLVLPPTCAALLRRFGPFLYVSRGDEGEEPRAALYAPARFLTVPEWRSQVRRAPLEAGDTPRAR